MRKRDRSILDGILQFRRIEIVSLATDPKGFVAFFIFLCNENMNIIRWLQTKLFQLSALFSSKPVASVSDCEMKTMLSRLKSVQGKYYLALKRVEKEYWEHYSFSSLQKVMGMEKRSLASLKPKTNMKIVQESFGEGIIQKVDRDHVLVLFGNDTKTLNWKFLVDHHKFYIL